MAMTSEAKSELSKTIRSLRARLLRDLQDATEATYRLAVRTRDAGLEEGPRTCRGRLEAWVAEQLRAQEASGLTGKHARTAADFGREVEKQRAYTLLNRLVFLRLLEDQPPGGGRPLRTPAVVTGGWESQAYQPFRELAPGLVQDDETEGYAFLLQLVFEDLATDLPGLFGPSGIAELIPIPASTLRHVVEELDKVELQSCWTDDMTLGWVYQYWNDPEREAIDTKLNAGGKVEPYEIASKTQLFTERYMVDWLLQNSLGPMWLAMCRKHGWAPEVEADGTLDHLEQRRVEWRAKRDAGDVSLTALIPLHTEAERHWAYYVPQPIPDDAVTHAPDTVRDLKILDPAVGSGHFLVVALGLLVALYQEEARHRGTAGEPEWTDRAIVERILSHNLHGIDLDPRAVQIAAAALWLKAHQVAPDARPERLNLVASNLRLASLPDDDPSLVELRLEVERETGIPGVLTDTIVHALRGADHLGSLLKVDRAVDEAIEAQETTVAARFDPQQVGMFEAPPPQQGQIAFEAAAARQSLLDRLETFLSRHTSGDDLGLRLRGEQLAAGVRFVRMVREGTYDLVVANPPYQGISKMVDADYVQEHYSLGKADLYAAFLLRGLQLARVGGVSSMLTMRNWMFIKQYVGLREHLLNTFDLRGLGDFAIGAFDEVPNDLLSVAVSVFHHASPRADLSVAQQPSPPGDRSYDRERTGRKRAATLSGIGRLEFDTTALMVVPEWPLIYWWGAETLNRYQASEVIGHIFPARFGMNTGNNSRFTRACWEVASSEVWVARLPDAASKPPVGVKWVPFVMGAKGRAWFENLRHVVRWEHASLELHVFEDHSIGCALRNKSWYFKPGVAIAMIGNSFAARAHRFASAFDSMGTSLFPLAPAKTVESLNARVSRDILESLNPTIHFQVGDINRLPTIDIGTDGEVFGRAERAFTVHETHRESSVEFRQPGPSPWRHAKDWAQATVDRLEGAALPTYEAEYDTELPTDHLSFTFGVALGRFKPNGEGALDPTVDDPSHALPVGILFLDGTLDGDDLRDSLGQPAAAQLHEAWSKYGAAIDSSRDGLREWLALDFFKDVHKAMYENRPIHWPLSSAQKTFVAWVNIHRFTEQTLRVLLADHLRPTLTRIEGELNDLRIARDGADKKAARAAEKSYDRLLKAKEELREFIANVEQCADRGAPRADAKCPLREQDARYSPNLDDGVMINSSALWPLLEPQWKDPKKWWRELSEAKGKKDYDWSHLAMRYWPDRVDAKCRKDPSLGVAHGCFWRYHPERAWAWELRLQDEMGPDFRIDEAPYMPGGRDIADPGSDQHRSTWLRDHTQEALAAVEKEALRRIRRATEKQLPSMRILEVGLWSHISDDVWDMELRVSEKQGVEFRLLSPDEPDARASFEAAHPDRVEARTVLLASLEPRADLFRDAEDQDDHVSENEANADGDEEDAETDS